MKQAIIILFATAILASCKEKKQDSPETPATTTTVSTDSTAIRKVITDFYEWYSANYSKMMGYKLYSGTKKSDQPPYKINWDEVNRYQAFIRDSIPQLGAEFLVNQKKQFEQSDSAFKVDVKEELPYGFDYDWFTNSQEDASWLLNGIKTSNKWMVDVKGETASVEIGTPEDKNYVTGALLLYVGLKKENGQWKITKIGND